MDAVKFLVAVGLIVLGVKFYVWAGDQGPQPSQLVNSQILSEETRTE
jgi:hypothetical protein